MKLGSRGSLSINGLASTHRWNVCISILAILDGELFRSELLLFLQQYLSTRWSLTFTDPSSECGWRLSAPSQFAGLLLLGKTQP